MTQTEGEKELVLGNKQLISLFFVVVALCGVFFAMGYMIGRNTSKSAVTNPHCFTSPEAPVSPPESQTTEPPRETLATDPTAEHRTVADASPLLLFVTQPAPRHRDRDCRGTAG